MSVRKSKRRQRGLADLVITDNTTNAASIYDGLPIKSRSRSLSTSTIFRGRVLLSLREKETYEVLQTINAEMVMDEGVRCMKGEGGIV